MSIFEKPKILLKKQYIITSSASACAIPRTLPLCFVFYYLYLGNKSIMQWFAYSHKNRRKMVQKMGELFWGILGWMFLGDVLKKVAEV
jgi:hypothetical protein